jgi:16S rRNA (cytidine1402-2'-O)-methyltransferase
MSSPLLQTTKPSAHCTHSPFLFVVAVVSAAAAQAAGLDGANTSGSNSSSSSSSSSLSSSQHQQQQHQQQQDPALEQALYIVGTPIGNLEDISFRALRILRSASLILAEDTRHTRKLLEHFAIRTPTLSCHQHNEKQRQELVLQRLQAGEVRAVRVVRQ